MKIQQIILLFSLNVFIFSSCNEGEGQGGSSSVEGYVYNVRHHEDNSQFPVDTIPASKEDVFIIYGNDDYFGDDIETNEDGYYKFNYLRKGDYTVFAYSTYNNGTREGVYKTIKVGSGANRVEPIYIHTGKAYGTSMIRGMVYAKYYDNDRLVVVDGEYLFPAVGHRVYLKYAGQDIILDDVRTDNNGVFVFQRLVTGTYEVYTDTELAGDNYKNVIFPTESQIIEITGEQHIIYDLPKEFIININT